MEQKILRILFVNASPGQVEAWRQVGQAAKAGEVVGPIYLPVDNSTTDLPAYILRLYDSTTRLAPRLPIVSTWRRRDSSLGSGHGRSGMVEHG